MRTDFVLAWLRCIPAARRYDALRLLARGLHPLLRQRWADDANPYMGPRERTLMSLCRRAIRLGMAFEEGMMHPYQDRLVNGGGTLVLCVHTPQNRLLIRTMVKMRYAISVVLESSANTTSYYGDGYEPERINADANCFINVRRAVGNGGTVLLAPDRLERVGNDWPEVRGPAGALYINPAAFLVAARAGLLCRFLFVKAGADWRFRVSCVEPTAVDGAGLLREFCVFLERELTVMHDPASGLSTP